MRVGFFTYGMNERMTGIARYTVQLTYALKKLESSLEIILLNPYPSSKHPWYKDFETYPLPHLRLLPSAASLGNLLLHQAARNLKLDILHDPCGIAPFLFPTKAYKRVTTRNPYSPESCFKPSFARVASRLTRCSPSALRRRMTFVSTSTCLETNSLSHP
jgi:hypothetical protein